jgi:hypothetical protein
VLWIVVNHRSRAHHNDRQPDAGLSHIAQVAEQHGGEHAGDGHRRLANDQSTIEERQGGADPPGRGRHDQRCSTPRQQDEDHHHTAATSSPRWTPIGPVRVGASRRADRRGERQDRDQRVQTAGGEELSRPIHDANVSPHQLG